MVIRVAASASVRAIARRSDPALVSSCSPLFLYLCGRRTHDISLCPDGNKSIDMLANRDQDLPGHVSALLCTGSLVLNMDSCCSFLDEEFRELHHGCETAVSGVCICDDGAEVVDVCEL